MRVQEAALSGEKETRMRGREGAKKRARTGKTAALFFPRSLGHCVSPAPQLSVLGLRSILRDSVFLYSMPSIP